MPEHPDPRRPRPPSPPPDPGDVFELADEEPAESPRPSSATEPGADEAIRPSAMPAPTPLPRLWKAEPEPEPEPEPKAAKDQAKPVAARPKAARKAKVPASDDGERKGVLLEETPALDTYEARQKARLVVGGILLGGVLLGGYALMRVLSPPTAPTVASDAPAAAAAAAAAPAPAPAPADNPEKNEREARALYERAHEVARTGDAEVVVSLLAKVTTAYPNTAAAADARAALDRPSLNLPLFPDRPAVLARRAEAPAPPPDPAPPTAVVEATPAAPASPGTGEARLVLPANPAEPARASAAAPVAAAPAAAEATSRPLPSGFRARPGAGVHASGWPLEVVGDRDGAPMVLVPGGTFLMGRDDGEINERPAHRVTVATFYIDLHEVTVRQFDLFQKETGLRADRERAVAREANAAATSDDAPVVMVSARDAKDYADWAGKRLPTEAQWEMAARGTDGRIHPWGASPPNWEKKREPRQIDPIMSFAGDVSPYGARDMAGNAWEWTKDWYDPRFFQLFKSQVADNPTGPSNRPRSLQLTVKGGAKDWIVTHRDGLKYEARLPYLGFRCVLPVEGPDNALNPAAPAPAGQPAAPKDSIPF